MSLIGPKLAPLRLDPVSYQSLRQQVLRRDGWRCQLCGTMSNLEVHHREFRSHSGDDSEENLITLCSPCHHEAHCHSVSGINNGSQQEQPNRPRGQKGLRYHAQDSRFLPSTHAGEKEAVPALGTERVQDEKR
jgi:hypothetical protein